ncbi:hypothetical protein PG984_009947 [Apiospora sp. TS-2023a]
MAWESKTHMLARPPDGVGPQANPVPVRRPGQDQDTGGKVATINGTRGDDQFSTSSGQYQ